MTLGAAALLMASAAQANAPAAQVYPLAEVLDAAAALCQIEPAGRGEAGWSRFSPDPQSWFGTYAAGITEGGSALKVTSDTLSTSVAGRTLFALRSRLDFTFAPGKPAYSCEVFDPAAPEIDGAAIRRWARRTPRRASPKGAAWFYARWEPGFGRGVSETSITSIAPDQQDELAKPRPGLAYTSLIQTKGQR